MPSWILLILLAAAALWIISAYNGLVSLKNQTLNAFKQIDVQLKRRHDLIPNLVNAVRGAMNFEKDTLEAVIQARNQAVKVNAAGPDAVKQIVRSGHDIGGHAYTQDQLLSYMSLEEQEKTIRQSIDLLQACSGKKVTGWASPVVGFTPETAGFLAKAGLSWTTDVTYVDLPIKIHTPHGTIAGVPTTDFSDNRVLRANPRDLYDTHKGTFEYLVQNEPMGLLVLVIHCQFGGRPLISAVLQELLQELARSPDVWFARHEELARWALAADVDEHTYRSRFF